MLGEALAYFRDRHRVYYQLVALPDVFGTDKPIFVERQDSHALVPIKKSPRMGMSPHLQPVLLGTGPTVSAL